MLERMLPYQLTSHRAGRRQSGRVTLALALLLAAGLIAAWMYLSPVVRAGSGYAAKNICSGHFVSGMPGRTLVDQALAGASPLLADVAFDIDVANASVQTRLFGMFARTATYEPGAGCTLQPDDGSLARQNLELQSVAPLNPGVPWPHGSAPAAQSQQLQRVVDAAFAEPDPETAPRNTKAVVVVHKGRLLAERYAPGVTASTPLIGWSMTKSVTNLLFGLLVNDGTLSVADPAPVTRWQTEDNDPRAAITVDQLLRMSSGLRFDEDYDLYSDVVRMLSNEPDMADFAASMGMAGPPNSIWSYSSGTSNILAAVMTEAAGGTAQSIYDFAHTRLFAPLGIRTAVFEMDTSGKPVGSSYLHASARDWARLGQLCLQNGSWNGKQLLPPDWLSYSTEPTPTDPANGYGAHFWLNRQPADPSLPRAMPEVPEDAYFMNGYQGQRLVVVPSAELVIVRLGFTPGGNHGVESLTASILSALGQPSASDVAAD